MNLYQRIGVVSLLLAFAGPAANARVLLEDVCGGVSFGGMCYTCTDPSAQIDTPALESGAGCTCSTGVCLQAPEDDLSNTSPAPAGPSGGDDTDNDDNVSDDDFTDDDASGFSDDDVTDDDASGFSDDDVTEDEATEDDSDDD